MIIFIKDNFITKQDCDWAIETYKKNQHKAKSFRDVYPLEVPIRFLPKLNKQSFELNRSQVDWAEIVRWPIGSHQSLHFDNAKDNTTLASIVYLNDDYDGGHTYFENDIVVTPKQGRALFFDGKYFKHGVNTVSGSERFVVAAWYKPITQEGYVK